MILIKLQKYHLRFNNNLIKIVKTLWGKGFMSILDVEKYLALTLSGFLPASLLIRHFINFVKKNDALSWQILLKPLPDYMLIHIFFRKQLQAAGWLTAVWRYLLLALFWTMSCVC
jgi:hypothetical protein